MRKKTVINLLIVLGILFNIGTIHLLGRSFEKSGMPQSMAPQEILESEGERLFQHGNKIVAEAQDIKKEVEKMAKFQEAAGFFYRAAHDFQHPEAGLKWAKMALEKIIDMDASLFHEFLEQAEKMGADAIKWEAFYLEAQLKDGSIPGMEALQDYESAEAIYVKIIKEAPGTGNGTRLVSSAKASLEKLRKKMGK